jgi:hypothetical protein
VPRACFWWAAMAADRLSTSSCREKGSGFGATTAHDCSAEATVGGTIVARYLQLRAVSLAESDPEFACCVRLTSQQFIACRSAR